MFQKSKCANPRVTLHFFACAATPLTPKLIALILGSPVCTVSAVMSADSYRPYDSALLDAFMRGRQQEFDGDDAGRSFAAELPNERLHVNARSHEHSPMTVNGTNTPAGDGSSNNDNNKRRRRDSAEPPPVEGQQVNEHRADKVGHSNSQTSNDNI